jgi:hypothetical protein
MRSMVEGPRFGSPKFDCFTSRQPDPSTTASRRSPSPFRGGFKDDQ